MTRTEIPLLTDLHNRFVGGDSAALETLFRRLFHKLQAQLRRAFPHTRSDLIADAVQEAFIDYSQSPTHFDPSRNISLERFLYCACWRNVADALQAETTRRMREAAFVELVSRHDSSTRELECVLFENDSMVRTALSLANTQCERAAARLWLVGERRTAPLAAALGVLALDTTEQRREVKRFKDRLSKRIERLLAGNRTLSFQAFTQRPR